MRRLTAPNLSSTSTASGTGPGSPRRSAGPTSSPRSAAPPARAARRSTRARSAKGPGSASTPPVGAAEGWPGGGGRPPRLRGGPGAGRRQRSGAGAAAAASLRGTGTPRLGCRARRREEVWTWSRRPGCGRGRRGLRRGPPPCRPRRGRMSASARPARCGSRRADWMVTGGSPVLTHCSQSQRRRGWVIYARGSIWRARAGMWVRVDRCSALRSSLGRGIPTKPGRPLQRRRLRGVLMV